MSSATRIGLDAGSTMPSWPTRMRLVCMREVEIEQHRVVGELEALDVEVVLGEGDRVVAEVVGQPDLLGQLPQHALVEVGAHARPCRPRSRPGCRRSADRTATPSL